MPPHPRALAPPPPLSPPSFSAQLDDFEAWAPQLVTPVLVRADHVALRDLSVMHAAADMSGFFEGDCDAQSASNLHSGAIQLNCTDSSGSGVAKGCTDVAVERVSRLSQPTPARLFFYHAWWWWSYSVNPHANQTVQSASVHAHSLLADARGAPSVRLSGEGPLVCFH